MEQPWLQSWLTESRAPDVRASSGKLGNERRAVWVDLIWLPSGSVTERGNLARCRLVHTLVYCRKWPVVPLSTMALFPGVASGGIRDW
jgi:hypothetical protein